MGIFVITIGSVGSAYRGDLDVSVVTRIGRGGKYGRSSSAQIRCLIIR
jgi:hypothetical protein